MKTSYDVAIIGGGPGGATAGAILARAGQRVLIVEREIFPRFHIGESLLPMGNEILIESGAWEKVCQAGFLPKHGAEFVTSNGAMEQRFWFRQGLKARHTQTFQVERAEFDKVLLDHAAASGCDVRQGAVMRGVKLDASGADVTFVAGGTEQTARVNWVIDASGRETFLGRTLGLAKEELPLPKRIAIYGHFADVPRHAGEVEGHITIVRLADGWFWIIPLAHGKTSVGMVCSLATFQGRGRDAAACFAETVQASTALRTRMAAARRLTDLLVTSDYTFSYATMAGDRYILVGDAGTFVDPIFSSGVLIATKTGSLAARMILRAAGRPLTARAKTRYTREIKRIRDLYLRMIRAFYDNDGFSVFMQPVSRLQLVESVNAVLGGNTERRFGLWWRLELFHFFCRLQRRRKIVPPVSFAEARPIPT